MNAQAVLAGVTILTLTSCTPNSLSANSERSTAVSTPAVSAAAESPAEQQYDLLFERSVRDAYEADRTMTASEASCMADGILDRWDPRSDTGGPPTERAEVLVDVLTAVQAACGTEHGSQRSEDAVAADPGEAAFLVAVHSVFTGIRAIEDSDMVQAGRLACTLVATSGGSLVGFNSMLIANPVAAADLTAEMTSMLRVDMSSLDLTKFVTIAVAGLCPELNDLG